jgi:hypothetical protein
MGYNRSGVRRTARQKRHKREMQRLAAKAEAGQEEGLVAKVKHLAHDAAAKVGEVAKAAVEKVTGHKK